MPGDAARPLAGAVAVLAAVACAAPLPVPEPTWNPLRRDPESPLASLESVPTAAIPPPEGLRSASGQPRSVPLKWDPLLTGDVAGYVIERAPAREGPFARLAAVEGHLSTLYIDRGGSDRSERQAPALEDGATYFYRVRSHTSEGRVSVAASEVAVATTAPVPGPPRGLRAYSYQPRQVPLGWRASPDATAIGYVVYRSPSSGGPFEPIARLEGRHATVYVDSGLGDLRVFYYRAAALNGFGAEGPPSEPVRAVTKPEPLPPIGLRAAEQRLGANRLAWEPNVETDIREYRLLRIREGADAPELVTAVPPETTAAEDRAVAAGERVAYALVAVDGDGLQSGPSESIGVESQGYGLSARAESDGVHLRWNPRTEEGFRGARIVRTRWLTGQELAFVESDAYVDREAKPGARYRYVVTLERADASRAPPSVPVAVEVPKREGGGSALR